MVKKQYQRVLIILGIGVVLTLWLLANIRSKFTSAIIYLAFAVISYLFYTRGGITGKLSGRFGIDSWGDIWLGVGAGVGFIVLSMVSPLFKIGVPTIALSLDRVGQVLLVGGIAPIFEEIFFRGLVFNVLSKKFKMIFTIILSSVMFALFHALAYGSFYDLIGSYIGAFIFGIIAGVLTWKTDNILPSLIMHSVVNLWIIQKFVLG